MGMSNGLPEGEQRVPYTTPVFETGALTNGWV